jgi:hypothetical protein
MALVATQAQRDAHSLLRGTFARYGLGGEALATWALESLISGKGIDQILLELEERPEFKQAFPEIEARRARSAETGIQLSPISPAEILEYRTAARQLMASYGLPANFYSQNQDFFDLIVGDTSMSELNDRLETASRRVAFAPPEVREMFSEMYGHAGDQALFTLFTDVERSLPSLQEMTEAAEAGGAARRYGFGLNRAEAELMASYNIDYDAAVQGFGKLYEDRGLFNETLTEGDDFTVGQQGVAAAFGLEGQDALRRRGEARRAATAGFAGGGFQEEGASGLGTADQR